MNRSLVVLAITAWGVLLSSSIPSAAQSPSIGNWPRFRGPNGTATGEPAPVPVEWTDSNILWKTPLEGIGVSSPCVWGNWIWLTAADEKGLNRSVQGFDAKTGKRVWRQDIDASTHKKHNKNSFATATCATDGERVFAVFTSAEAHLVLAFTAEGSPLWRYDLGPFSENHGSGASPIVAEDLLIVCNEQTGPSSILALDTKTGQPRWQFERKAERTAFSTPFLYGDDSGRYVVVSSTQGVTALSLETGMPRWTCDRFDARVVGSPFWADGLVCAHSGSGNAGHNLIAIRPDGTGDVSDSKVVWEITKQLPYCITPLAVGEYIFYVTDAGIACCLKAQTGEQVWNKRLGGKFAASPVGVADRIYLVSEAGKVVVIAAEPEYRELAHNHLDDQFLSTPALVGDRMILRGEEHLWCIGNP